MRSVISQAHVLGNDRISFYSVVISALRAAALAAVALRNAPAGAVTAPHRWLRTAHKIAPDGAQFHGISYY